MSQLRHGQLTYRLRGLIFRARNELKTGWSEEIYHKHLVSLAQDQEIPVMSKPRRMLYHRGIEVHLFEPDLIVWDKIILELKALPFETQFAGEHYAQLIHYLKFYEKDLGLLINFASTPIMIKRVIWDEPELEIVEDYSTILSDMTDADRKHLRHVRHHLLAVAQQYGLGYPESVYRKIVAIEFSYHEIPCEIEIAVPAKWNGALLAHHNTQHLLVESSYLIHIRSLLDRPTKYDFASAKTYLTCLGLKFGLVVNFGKKQFQIYGIKAD